MQLDYKDIIIKHYALSRAGGWPPVLDYVFTYSGSRPSYMILNSP